MSKTTMVVSPTTAQELSEMLADVFRTAEAGEVFTDDVFLDGHPPFWRFQLSGVEAFSSWLKGYAANRPDVEVVRTTPTAAGFLTEFTSVEHDEHGTELTARKVVICDVRDNRIAEMTVYCSGDWNPELRARHATEAPMIRA